MPDATRLERLLGAVLRTGVRTAAIVLVLGGAWYLVRHGTEPLPPRDSFTPYLQAAGPWPILQSALRLESRGLIGVGLLLVIAIPLARVFASACAFAFRRDWLFVGLTSAVLTILLGSLFLAL